ncbi:Tubulin/FtsZ family, GTPase domain containing protein, putative [Angomonas deanei]|uniref:Tubulin/FtsZ family, GTPase domain containing protein, putative n=1 Tax=Angomonas deanei TaxID=59799 RepID=A0A7G2C6Q5_9TRYP|nr:Tubulin/FtsZ family, GTPase domain containing protein, putative [Angomonas deanei]
MAIVCVLVGQCGNQLGDELLSQLAVITDKGKVPSPFFHSERKARFVLVDSEPKVVEGFARRQKELIRPDNVVFGQSGRGNNWALGYYGINVEHSKRSEARSVGKDRAFANLHRGQRESDDNLIKRALQAIYMETRRTSDAEEFEAIIVMHSLVGGTGSGVASRLAEKIRLYFIEPPEGVRVDEVYEDKMARMDGLDGMMFEKRRARYLLSVTVAPQSLGEMCTQGINASLTLNVLQKQTDAVILLRNDDAMTSGNEKRGSSSSTLVTRASTFKEANEILISTLLPVFGFGVSGAGSVGLLVEHCAPRIPRITGGNNILSLVPTPQRTYEAFKKSVLRGCFYPIQGAKDFMPGCKAQVPVEALLSQSAMARFMIQKGEVEVPRGKQRVFKDRWDDQTEEEQDKDSPPEIQEIPVQAPSKLSAYYKKLKNAPVTSLYEQIEGVLVMNEVRELNQRLLFPLLRSAALKVKAGAFLSTYQDVGVEIRNIESAYHEVAQILSAAEDL